VIRSATPRDWERVAALLSASSLPTDGAREHIGDFVVAERDGELVGCASIERYEETGLLRSVAVSASERGRGTGADLVRRCISEAAQAGLGSLVLLTTTAERYFPRFGFEVIGRSEVPASVHASAEFQGACPSSAVAMRLTIPPANEVRIRNARPDDATAIAAIYNAGIRARTATFETRERTTADVEAWFAADTPPILVAERDGRILGWIAASAYRPRVCYAGIAEFSVYVDPAEQGRRVGDSLIRAFLPALEGAGYWKVLSRIFPENVASLALCRRHGFREVGRYERHARLDGVWRDVVIVERLLGEAAAVTGATRP
jgi:phosphinothricin acetyltransferase